MNKLFTEGTKGEEQKETEIGLVPESWEVVKLEKLYELIQYGTSVKCSYDETGYPVLRIPNVVGGHIDISDLKFGTPKNKEFTKLELEKDDLLFVRTNGQKIFAGRCSIFKNEITPCYYASYLIRIKVKKEKLLPQFLNYYTKTDLGNSFLCERAIRTADGKFNINTGILKSVLVPIPEIKEQELIIKVLEKIDSKIKSHSNFLSNLQYLFKTILHELMTGKRRVKMSEPLIYGD